MSLPLFLDDVRCQKTHLNAAAHHHWFEFVLIYVWYGTYSGQYMSLPSLLDDEQMLQDTPGCWSPLSLV